MSNDDPTFVNRWYRALKCAIPGRQSKIPPPNGSPSPPTIPRVKSEYIDWLRYANAGMMAKGNVDAIDYVMGHLESEAPILEIGSFCGLSTNAITHFKERHGRRNRLITCDRWMFENAAPEALLGESLSVSHAAYREFVKASYIRNIRLFSAADLPFTVELFSDECFEAWRAERTLRDVLDREVTLGGPISFVFIDGNHTYAFARRDFENSDAFLVPGGFILFDDSGPKDFPEVHQVVQEVLAEGRYALIAANPNYLLRRRR